MNDAADFHRDVRVFRLFLPMFFHKAPRIIFASCLPAFSGYWTAYSAARPDDDVGSLKSLYESSGYLEAKITPLV